MGKESLALGEYPSDFYDLCKDSKYSHIVECDMYNKNGCPMICWYAAQKRIMEKNQQVRTS